MSRSDRATSMQAEGKFGPCEGYDDGPLLCGPIFLLVSWNTHSLRDDYADPTPKLEP